MILRLPMRVELFDEKDQLIETIISSKKSQIRLRVQGISKAGRRIGASSWVKGTCRVFYNKPNNYWNEFTFTSLSQFDAGLITVTEKPLIDYLRPEIPETYLQKRELSEAQKEALKKARERSGLV